MAKGIRHHLHTRRKQREDQPCRADDHQPAPHRDEPPPLAHRKTGQEPEREQQLPTKWVEEPAPPVGVVGKVEIQDRSREPQQDRKAQDPVGPPIPGPKCRGRHEQKHGIEWQNVCIAQLMGEQRHADQKAQRVAVENVDHVLLHHLEPAEVAGGHGGDAKGNDRRDDMNLIKRPDPAPDLGYARPIGAGTREILAIGHTGRNPRHQDKAFGSIGKAEVPRRPVLEDRAGRVVDEDGDQREPTEHIQPRVAFGPRFRRLHVLPPAGSRRLSWRSSRTPMRPESRAGGASPGLRSGRLAWQTGRCVQGAATS